MKKIYFENIDILKAIACILVIINHTSSYLLTNENYLNFYKIEFVLCRIAVPIFVMSTGYLMCTKKLTLKDSLKKIFKVFIPLFIMSFLIYFLQHKNMDFYFFKNFFQNPITEPYWYIYMLVGLYLIMPFLNQIVRNINIKEYVFLIMLTLIIPAFLKLLPFEISSYWLLTIPNYIIGYYLMGSFFYKVHEHPKFIQLSGLLFIVLYIVGIICYSSNHLKFYNIDSLLLVSMSILFMNYILGIKITRKHKFLNLISANSFYIYLFHPVLQNKIYKISALQYLISFNYILGILAYQLILLLICLLLAHFINYMIKKITLAIHMYN